MICLFGPVKSRLLSSKMRLNTDWMIESLAQIITPGLIKRKYLMLFGLESLLFDKLMTGRKNS